MGPIRGQTRPMPVEAGVVAAQQLDARLNASIHNRFDVEVVDAATGKIKQRAQAENVICNQLWTRMLSPAMYFNYIHYGSGAGTPAVSDTSLFTFLGYGTPDNDTIAVNHDNNLVSLRRRIQLSDTTAVGSNITEVGIGYSTSASSLCTHAMLKDMSGNQISITKTATDIINIYATVFLHFPAPESGVTVHDCAVNAFNNDPVYHYTENMLSWFLGIGSKPSYIKSFYTRGAITNGGGNNSTLAATTFSAGNYLGDMTGSIDIAAKRITLSATRLAAGVANLSGGIGAINIVTLPSNAGYKYNPMLFISLLTGNPWYSGTTVTGEAIGTGDGSTADFQTNSPFASAATVYVNGAASSTVTVENKPQLFGDMGQYFRLIEASNGNTIPGILANGNSGNYASAGNYAIYYNPYFTYGIKSFSLSDSYLKIEVSNDLSTWTDITSRASSVSSAYRTYKYWKLTYLSSSESYIYNMVADTLTSANNIHFTTAPASGAVITADYTTPVIAKDVNHVFDLTVTIQLGEHTA